MQKEGLHVGLCARNTEQMTLKERGAQYVEEVFVSKFVSLCVFVERERERERGRERDRQAFFYVVGCWYAVVVTPSHVNGPRSCFQSDLSTADPYPKQSM